VRYHPVIMIGGNWVLIGLPRRWGVLASVVLLHILVLWWLQTGLMRDATPVVTPVTLIGVALDAPVSAPPHETRTPPSRVMPLAREVPKPERTPAPVPTPAVVPTPMPVAPATAAAVVTPAPEAMASAGPPPSTAIPSASSRTGVPAASGPATSVVLPSAQAAYLHNPPPAYPAMSRRLAEQGRVLVRVLIGADGLPQKAELQAGSGYDRLDRAALDSVMRWRFVPGRRGDVPETMWVSVPIVFNLE